MLLRWNTENMTDQGSAYFKETDTYNNRLPGIAWVLANINIQSLTKNNYKEAYYRYLRAYEYDGTFDMSYTLLDFKMAIGFSTNVISITSAQFNKRMNETGL